ncbi:MAG: ABC transporter ATP-binding protein [Salinibacterium sp.]|nr:ABC transporter ATP-binding protein [Salinibacterium sp.]
MSRLELAGLSLTVLADDVETELVHEISLSVAAGETLCIVGESGSGKTVTAMSIIRLLEFVAPVRTTGGILLERTDIPTLTAEEMRAFRTGRIGMVFQEALDSLNPSQRIGKQLLEAYSPRDMIPGALRTMKGQQAAMAKATSLLREVGLPDTERIMALYPHQLSGGMQQRIMIALALMSDPILLLADEPTTALDVTTQAEILELFRRLQREHNMSCVFITHDMGVAAEISDRIAVMYGGRLVEVGTTRDILTKPRHHYTRALLECVPQLGVRRTSGLASIPGAVPSPRDELLGCRYAPRCPAATEVCTTAPPTLAATLGDTTFACFNPATRPLDLTIAVGETDAPALVATDRPTLTVSGITKVFGNGRRTPNLDHLRKRAVVAVRDVSLHIAPGEFFGLVGESGSGKTTLGRMIAALEHPSAGTISVGDHEHTSKGVTGDSREFRRSIQLIFQDPQSSLDPRHTVARIIGEPLRELTNLRGAELDTRVASLIDEVGLPAATKNKLPSQLSGGQRQRVAIARAIGPEPRLIVADEPTSALDVSVQGQVINILLELRRERDLSFLFITHNLSLVLSVADRVGVMCKGELVEVGHPTDIVTNSTHPYTRQLLAANPDLLAYQTTNP